jgi:hypothetical protein
MGRIKNYFTADKMKMLRIFLSVYCVILIIAVLPSFIIAYNSLSIINEGEEESMAKKLEIISKNMDAAHMRMITYLSSLANNTVLTELSKLHQPLRQEDIMTVYLSIREINKMYAAYIYSTNSIIEDFILNYGTLDIFISRSASYSGDFYLSHLFTDKSFNLRSLLMAIENGDSKRIMFLRVPKEEMGGGGALILYAFQHKPPCPEYVRHKRHCQIKREKYIYCDGFVQRRRVCLYVERKRRLFKQREFLHG